MKNPFTDLQKRIADMEDDFSKFFDKSNKAAGTRVRQSLKELKDEAQRLRMEVQNMKNTAAAAGSGAPKKPATGAAAAKKAAAANKKNS